jgi:hypothetical protein
MEAQQALETMSDEMLCAMAEDYGNLRFHNARQELERRGITPLQRLEILAAKNKQKKAEVKEEAVAPPPVLTPNETEEYSPLSKLILLVYGPVLLIPLPPIIHIVHIFLPHLRYRYLKKNGFKRKIEQRRKLLIASFVFWIVWIGSKLAIGYFRYYR